MARMSKAKSFGWGLVSSFGGLVVALLLYFLYLKKKKVNPTYFWIGFFSITIALFTLLGSVVLLGIFGILTGGIQVNP